jgi:hypothetical protein
MRKVLVAAVLAVVTFAVAAPAAAGGWAVTTLDPLATAPVAGEPFEVGFTIRQHGRTPVSLPDAAIIVTGPDGRTTRFPATPQGPEGHHVATVEIAAPGPVTWAVEQGLFGQQDLGTLDVGGAATTGSAGTGSSPWTTPLFAVAALLAALGLADVGRGLFDRRRRHAVPA